MQNRAQSGTGSGTSVARKAGRRTEAMRSAELAESLPKGIAIGQWADGRGKPYFIRRGPRTARVLESFASEQDRNDAAEKLAQAVDTGGRSIIDVDMAGWQEWRAFRERCPAPLHELEAMWAKRAREAPTLRLGEAIDRYLALRLAEDHPDPKKVKDGFRHARLHLRRLKEKLGPLMLGDVNADALRDVMEKLVDPDTGHAMTNTTKRDHRKNWRTFFTRCVREGWMQQNPAELVVPPPVDEEDPDVLTPREVFDLLKANRDEPVIGRMAFELFGGLRSSSAARLTPEHVKRDTKGIRLPGALHKSRKTKFRQGQPDVLWEWFDHAGDAMWTEVTQKNYDERKRDAFVRAKVRNPGNILRTSFVSYLLAATKNLPRVGYLAQHSRLQTTEIYEGVATEQDAKLVMAMGPAAVALEWEAFVAQAT